MTISDEQYAEALEALGLSARAATVCRVTVNGGAADVSVYRTRLSEVQRTELLNYYSEKYSGASVSVVLECDVPYPKDVAVMVALMHQRRERERLAEEEGE